MEAIKAHLNRIRTGFYGKYMTGEGIDVGYKGYDNAEPILNAKGIDFGTPGYDGIKIPLEDESQDYVFSSHCLEHLPEPDKNLKEWFRVLKKGGFLVIAVPHMYLYEKKKYPPSNWNADHKWFLTPGRLLTFIESVFEPNTYRVMHVRDNDDGFDYSIPPDKHSGGGYEIELVLKKIEPPEWKLLESKPIKKTIDLKQKETIEVNYPHLRPKTKLPQQELNFFLNYGGIGDYFQWTTAIEYIFENFPHLYGTLLVPNYYLELAQHFLGHYKQYKIEGYDKMEDHPLVSEENSVLRGPTDAQLINSFGFHLLELGFHYFANLDHVPDGYNKIPTIKGDEADISKFNLPENYAVVTTEATSPIRKLPGKTINAMTAHLKAKGVTPVFLGKAKLTDTYNASSDEDIITEGIIDLREKTTLLEACCILAHARLVAGLDNGLLHLACASMVPVIFAFNVAHPDHRVPPRQPGAYTCVIAPGSELSCRFCQSTQSFIVGHNYHHCLYGDAKCLEYMNADNFIKTIDHILEGKHQGG